MEDSTTRQLEKILLNKVYQLGLRRVIALLSANDDQFDQLELESSEAESTELVNNIKPPTAQPPQDDLDVQSDQPEPSIASADVVVSDDDRREIIRLTWANLIEFATEYCPTFIPPTSAPPVPLPDDYTNTLLNLANPDKIREWMEQRLGTEDDPFPQSLGLDIAFANTAVPTTSGDRAYFHLFDDLFIYFDHDDVVVYQNKHAYPPHVGNILGALELSFDIFNLKESPPADPLKVDQSDNYADIAAEINENAPNQLSFDQLMILTDVESPPALVRHLFSIGIANTSLGEQVFLLEVLKQLSSEQILSLTSEDITTYRLVYQYRTWKITKAKKCSAPKCSNPTSHGPTYNNALRCTVHAKPTDVDCTPFEQLAPKFKDQLTKIFRNWSEFKMPDEKPTLPPPTSTTSPPSA